jgi:hypothetical protein
MNRPAFILILRPEPDVDPIRALRGALKVLLRRFGLRAISVDAQVEDDDRHSSGGPLVTLLGLVADEANAEVDSARGGE